MKTKKGSIGNRAVRCTVSARAVNVAVVSICVIAIGCQICASILTFREHQEWLVESQSEVQPRRMFSRYVLRQPDRFLSEDDRVFSISFWEEAPSMAPTSAPSMAQGSMVSGMPTVNSKSNNSGTGILVGAVIGGLAGGILLMMAIGYVKRSPASTPLTAGASQPASPAVMEVVPPAPAILEVVPPPASVIAAAVAASDTDRGRVVTYKDQCQTVAKPPSGGGGNTATALSPPVARVSGSATETSGGSNIPFAVAVAMAPPSVIRPPLDP